jgi:hypothetical protein
MGSGHSAPIARERASRRGEMEPTAYSGPQMLLACGLVIVALIGLWGLLAPRGDEHASHPEVGHLVAIDGGHLRVEAVRDVDLSAPMAGPGMRMGPSSGVPDIPDGFRWVAVDLTVLADEEAMTAIDPDVFRVTGEGLGALVPVDVDAGGTIVPAGAALTRSFFYEVPEATAELMLWGPGSGDPIMLRLGPAPAPHGHG